MWPSPRCSRSRVCAWKSCRCGRLRPVERGVRGVQRPAFGVKHGGGLPGQRRRLGHLGRGQHLLAEHPAVGLVVPAYLASSTASGVVTSQTDGIALRTRSGEKL